MYCNSQDARKDLFQEISLQLWRSFDKFEGKSKISTWIYRIALNTAISFYRKQCTLPEIIDISDSIRKLNQDEDYENFEKDDQVRMLYAALNKLSKVERTIMFLYLEDYKVNEIAEIVGITPNNASVKMMRIKEKLKMILNGK